MKNSLNLKLKLYYKSIEDNLISDKKAKRIFMKNLKKQISDFIEETSNITFEKILDEFGTAEEICGFYSNDDIMKLKKNQKNFWMIFSCFALLAAFIISLLKQFF